MDDQNRGDAVIVARKKRPAGHQSGAGRIKRAPVTRLGPSAGRARRPARRQTALLAADFDVDSAGATERRRGAEFSGTRSPINKYAALSSRNSIALKLDRTRLDNFTADA